MQGNPKLYTKTTPFLNLSQNNAAYELTQQSFRREMQTMSENFNFTLPNVKMFPKTTVSRIAKVKHKSARR